MICAARKGFLTLSDCGNPALTACSNCARPMCPAHLSPTSGFTMCLDCAATMPADPNQNPQQQEQYDDVWAHRYRDDYYSSSGYRPVYDSHDRSSFDDRQRDWGEDEVDRGGFGAS